MKFLVLSICAILFSVSQAQAESVVLCGQTVEFNAAVPAKETPNGVYSGIWLGSITVNATNKPCVAFVVESIEPSGRTIVHQAWSDVGMNDKKSSGVLTWIGQFTKESTWSYGTLVLISTYVSYQLEIESTKRGTISGYVTDPEGRFPVELKRIRKF